MNDKLRIILLYPDSDPDYCKNLMGSNDPSSIFYKDHAVIFVR